MNPTLTSTYINQIIDFELSIVAQLIHHSFIIRCLLIRVDHIGTIFWHSLMTVLIHISAEQNQILRWAIPC